MRDKCKSCGCELHVKNNRNIVINDDTPDKNTELYTVITLVCENPQCVDFRKAFDVSIKEQVETTKNIEEGNGGV